jgi:predicted ATPase with chaperone activity
VIAIVPSATLLGVEGTPVSVEVHVSNGLPSYNIVGLPDAPCRESRDRVRAALLSSGLQWSLKRVTVNLAPSGTRKGGPGLDLPIAMGLLVASDVLPAEAIAGWGSGQNLNVASTEELAASPEVRDLIQGYVDQANSQLERWETIKKFAILPAELSIDEGEVTPSQKVRRRAVEQRYADRLNALYDRD